MGIDIFEIFNNNFGIDNSEIKITDIITKAQEKGRLLGKEKFDSLRNKTLMTILIGDKSNNPYIEISSIISNERSSLLVLANNPYYSTYAQMNRKDVKFISYNLCIVIHLYQANYDNFDKILDELYSLILNSESHWVFLNNIDNFKSDINLESSNKSGYLDAELQHLTELTIDHNKKTEEIKFLRGELNTYHKIYKNQVKTAYELKRTEAELKDLKETYTNLLLELKKRSEVPDDKGFLLIYPITLLRIKKFFFNIGLFDIDHDYKYFELVIFSNGTLKIELNLKNAGWTAEDLGLFSYYFNSQYFNENNYMGYLFEEWFTNTFQIISVGKTKMTAKNLLRYIRPYKGKKSENFNVIRSLFEEVLPKLE